MRNLFHFIFNLNSMVLQYSMTALHGALKDRVLSQFGTPCTARTILSTAAALAAQSALTTQEYLSKPQTCAPSFGTAVLRGGQDEGPPLRHLLNQMGFDTKWHDSCHTEEGFAPATEKTMNELRKNKELGARRRARFNRQGSRCSLLNLLAGICASFLGGYETTSASTAQSMTQAGSSTSSATMAGKLSGISGFRHRTGLHQAEPDHMKGSEGSQFDPNNPGRGGVRQGVLGVVALPQAARLRQVLRGLG